MVTLKYKPLRARGVKNGIGALILNGVSRYAYASYLQGDVRGGLAQGKIVQIERAIAQENERLERLHQLANLYTRATDKKAFLEAVEKVAGQKLTSAQLSIFKNLEKN